MQGQWEFYLSRVNGELASIFVDLSAAESAPDSAKPVLLWVFVEFRQPRPDGLSHQDEAPTLFKIEDALNETVADRLRALPVGRITTQGRREFYYYAASAEGHSQAVADAMTRYPEYRVAHGDQEDSDWTQYLDLLYPSMADRQRIENRKVLAVLKESGDALESPRPIDHWAYFSAAADRDAYAAVVVAQGFMVGESRTDDEAKRPFGVRFQRVDLPSQDAIDEITIMLADLAETHRGEYDGWETEVVNAPKPGLLGGLWDRLKGK